MNKMSDLLVVFNGNEIYPSNINKLYSRRLYTVSMKDYITQLQTQVGKLSGYIQCQISPESEQNFYSLHISNIVPLFPVNYKYPVLKSLYKELFCKDYKSTYADFMKHSGYTYTSDFIAQYLISIYVNNKLIKDYEKVYNYFKILEGGTSKKETRVNQYQGTKEMADEHLPVGTTDRRERNRIVNSIGISDSEFQGDIESEVRTKNFERIFRGCTEFI